MMFFGLLFIKHWFIDQTICLSLKKVSHPNTIFFSQDRIRIVSILIHFVYLTCEAKDLYRKISVAYGP